MSKHDAVSGAAAEGDAPSDGLPTMEQMEVTGPWRLGSKLVIRKGVPLPAWCIKSGELADDCFIRTMMWIPSDRLIWLLALPILPRTSIRMVTGSAEHAAMYVPVSRKWLVKRRLSMAYAALLLAASVAIFPVAANLGVETFLAWIGVILASMVLLFLCLRQWLRGAGLVHPLRITATHVFVGGVGPEFLEKLPQWKGGFWDA